MIKRSSIGFAVLLLAAVGSLQAAGKITTYTSRLSFAGDDSVDWGPLGTVNPTNPEKNGVGIGGSFTNLHSASGLVVVSGSASVGQLKRYDEGANWFGDFTKGDHLLNTNAAFLTIVFSSGPVYGAGLQIQSVNAGAFTGTMKAFDVNGVLLGTAAADGNSTFFTLPAPNTAPFIGIRSSQAEIASLQIDVTNTVGFSVNRMDVARTASPISNDTFFVSQQYRDIWNVLPDPTGVTNWVNQLTAGTVTRAQVAEAFINDARFYPNASYLAKLFLGPLQRDPDFTTWSAMFTQMQGGATRAAMLAPIMATPQYQAVYGSLTDLDFVTALYQNLLGRAPDPTGLNYWLLVLKFGVTRAAVLDGFLTSPEYDARVTNRVKANLMYFCFLRRTGEASGLNYWTIVLNFGVPPSVAIQGFITSPEYLARF